MTTTKKGQGVVIGLLFAFMLVAVFSIILAPLYEFITMGVNETLEADASHSDLIVLIIRVLPVFMALVVLVAIVMLITGSR